MSDIEFRSPTEGIMWRRYLQRITRYVPDFKLDPRKTALIVVDVQRSTADRRAGQWSYLNTHFPQIEQYYYTHLSEQVLPNIQALLRHFRLNRRRVIFLTVGSNLPDKADYNPLRRAREEEIIAETRMGTILSSTDVVAGNEVLPELQPGPDELIINKLGRNAFNSTGMDQILRNLGITGLIFCGVVTNGCVWATASDAAERGYMTVIVDDACAALTKLLHDSALLQFAHGYGKVMPVSDTIASLIEESTDSMNVPSAQPQ